MNKFNWTFFFGAWKLSNFLSCCPDWVVKWTPSHLFKPSSGPDRYSLLLNSNNNLITRTLFWNWLLGNPQRRVDSAWLSAVPDKTQLNLALSLTKLSLTHRCPVHNSAVSCPNSAWLSCVLDKTQLDSALSWTKVSLTQRCPGQRPAWLRAMWIALGQENIKEKLRIHKSWQNCSVIWKRKSDGIELS